MHKQNVSPVQLQNFKLRLEISRKKISKNYLRIWFSAYQRNANPWWVFKEIIRLLIVPIVATIVKLMIMKSAC